MARSTAHASENTNPKWCFVVQRNWTYHVCTIQRVRANKARSEVARQPTTVLHVGHVSLVAEGQNRVRVKCRHSRGNVGQSVADILKCIKHELATATACRISQTEGDGVGKFIQARLQARAIASYESTRDETRRTRLPNYTLKDAP